MTNKISPKKLRDFGFLIGFGFPFFIGWLIPFISGHEFRLWTILIGLPALISGIFFPKILDKPYKAWMNLGYCLGFINSRIILGIIFFIVVMPISMIMRLTGYDPLRLKKSNLLSYKEDHKGTKVDLNRIF